MTHRALGWLPAPAKRRLRRSWQYLTRTLRRPLKQRAFRRALSGIVDVAPSRPTDSQLTQLIAAWDNPAAADLAYLRVVIDLAARADGPVLECGSGLTSFLLAAYADHPVWTLEADGRWYKHVRREAAAAGLEQSKILHAPLEDYGDFYWYAIPRDLPDAFSLVVCDGPAAGGLKGGRIGLLPLLSDRLGPGVPIVVDSAMVYEATVIDRWEDDFGLVPDDHVSTHRVLRMPAPDHADRPRPADPASRP